jgi:hypothetical protein
VIVTRQAALRALPSLIGMPVNASVTGGFRDHDKHQPIGIIQRAYLDGKNLVVEGSLWGKNFGEVVATIKRHKDKLGLSYEISNTEIASEVEPIWRLTGLTFTGCSILLKSAAAYGTATAIAAAAAPPSDYAGILARLQRQARGLAG